MYTSIVQMLLLQRQQKLLVLNIVRMQTKTLYTENLATKPKLGNYLHQSLFRP